MSHPDPNGPTDLTPIQVGEVWENPVTRERGTILELPFKNPEGSATAELTALVGARVVGEHRHPALVERFTVLEGELTLKLDGQTSILREGESAVIEAGVWHDWWNTSDRDARARVEITPGERFVHMIETMFGLWKTVSWTISPAMSFMWRKGGTNLQDALIYGLDAEGKMTNRIHAARATVVSDAENSRAFLRLSNVEEYDLLNWSSVSYFEFIAKT